MVIGTARAEWIPSFIDEACLSLQFPHLGCALCIEHCPADAIRIECNGLRITEACHGCGRCVAACPTSALSSAAAGLGDRATIDRLDGAILIDCERMPRSGLPEDALTVHCLGGVGVNDLLGLRLRAGDRAIHLLDHGWCATCPASGGREHPAREIVTDAARSMAAIGVADRLLPSLVKHSSGVAPGPYGHASAAPIEVSRRDLLGRWLEPACKPVPAVTPTKAEPSSRRRGHKVNAAAGETRFILLQALADRFGGNRQARVMPVVTITDACAGHRVCVAMCPTGALSAAKGGDGVELSFDPMSCLACGACERGCPTGAIRVAATGSPLDAPDRPVLKRFAMRECADCGDRFVARASEEFCSSCRKSQGLLPGGGGTDGFFPITAFRSDQATDRSLIEKG